MVKSSFSKWGIWIPAFAGMTFGVGQLTLRLRSLLIRAGWVGQITRWLTEWGGGADPTGGYIRGTTLIGWAGWDKTTYVIKGGEVECPLPVILRERSD